jgi:hypothetical protein
VFRARDVKPGVCCNRCFVVLGTVDEVTQGIAALHASLL